MSSINLRSQLLRYGWVAGGVLLLLLFVTPLRAQNRDPDTRLFDERGRELSALERQRALDRDVENRGRQMNSPLSQKAYSLNPRAYGWRFRETRETRSRLRDVNDNLQQAIAQPQTTDYKRVAAYAAKIRTLASALQEQMGISKAAAEVALAPNAQSLTDAQLRTEVRAMDQTMQSILNNDMLRAPRIADAQLLDQAAQDLANLIKQSRRVKTLAEELRRR
jgi:hypothetical protein